MWQNWAQQIFTKKIFLQMLGWKGLFLPENFTHTDLRFYNNI